VTPTKKQKNKTKKTHTHTPVLCLPHTLNSSCWNIKRRCHWDAELERG